MEAAMKKKIITICILLAIAVAISAYAIYWLVPVRIYDDLGLNGKTVAKVTDYMGEKVYPKEKADEITEELSSLCGRRLKQPKNIIGSAPPSKTDDITVIYTDGTETSWRLNNRADGDVCFVINSGGSWHHYKMYDYETLYDCLGIKKRW